MLAVAVGVPEIWPVFELKERPAGRAGDTDQEVAVEPALVGSNDEIAVLTTYDTEDCAYEMSGAVRPTEIVNVAVALPAVLVAVTV